MTRALVSDDYREEQTKLRADSRIQIMAAEVKLGLDSGKVKLSDFAHEHSQADGPPGTPRHWFMHAATDEYVSRCEEADVTPVHRTIGAVATAILALATEEG